jgi:hypothetical protein
MDIFFTDPSEVPLPPHEVRIRELRAEPYPDNRRVRVYLEVDPFQRRPSADLMIVDSQGAVVAEASIIESMLRIMQVVIHLRGAQPAGEFTLDAVLYYAALPEGEAQPTPEPIERMEVDTAQATFTIE